MSRLQGLKTRLFMIATAGLLGMAVSTGTSSARADASISLVTEKTGMQVSWVQCPCYRVVAQTRIAGMQVETRNFVITTDALFELHDEKMMDLRRDAVDLKRLGAIEVLWKGSRVGLGFKGRTWGTDADRGYSELMRTGAYVLFNLLRDDAKRLDFRSGYDLEKLRANLGPPVVDERLTHSALLRWRSGRWSGRAMAQVGFDTDEPMSFESLDWGMSGSAAYQRRYRGLEYGVEGSLAVDHDGFRNAVGMEPTLVSQQVLFTLSYVAGGQLAP